MMMEKKLKKVAIFLLVIFMLSGFYSLIMASPQKQKNIKPGDCVMCHKKEKVLPNGHVPTVEMKLKDCKECHKKTEGKGLYTKMPLGHFHGLGGISCQGCHGKTEKPKHVEFDMCIKCHNVDKLVETTSYVKPENPHTSPHYGKELDCNLCHHQHKKSENFCNQCHNYNFTVP